jgi:Mrp family chromosome partitioning ATPase
VEAKDLAVQKSPNNPKWILPLEATSGLKILSFGHVNPRSGAPGAGGKGPAVMRGPIATRVINQLVAATDWGDLDYLIVDMPPGTGDMQITLSQAIAFTGAVIMTSPHELSLADENPTSNLFTYL